MKKQTPQPKRSPSARPKKHVPRPPAVRQASAPPKIKPLAKLEAEKKPVSYLRKYRYYVLGFIAALASFGLCVFLIRRQVLQGQEIRLFRFINDWPERLRPIFGALTSLGSIWAAAVMVMAAFLLRLYQLAWRLALSVFTTYGLLVVLKEFFARQRPEEFIGDLSVRALETSHAFPSAHTAIAVALALTVRSYLPIPASGQWMVVLVWIGGVGISRIYLGVHTPFDVAAGFALGVGVVCFWRILPKFIKQILHLK